MLRSTVAVIEVICSTLESCGLPAEAIQLIASADRRYVGELLKLPQYVALIIPRGGASLHQFCRENSTIPVITGGLGICHLYVEPSADIAPSIEVIHNAKTQRPSVCNALATILVHEQIAPTFLPKLFDPLTSTGVTFPLDPASAQILPTDA